MDGLQRQRLKIRERNYWPYLWLKNANMKLELLINTIVVDYAIKIVSDRTKGDAKRQIEVEERAKKKVKSTKTGNPLLIV
jgi:hypothetical protein